MEKRGTISWDILTYGIFALIVLIVVAPIVYDSLTETSKGAGSVLDPVKQRIDDIKNSNLFDISNKDKCDFARVAPKDFLKKAIDDGNAEFNSEQYAAARNSFQIFVDVCGEKKGTGLSLDDYNKKYECKLNKNEYKKLQDSCEEADRLTALSKLKESEEKEKAFRYQTYLDQGDAAFNRGEYSKAEEFYKKAKEEGASDVVINDRLKKVEEKKAEFLKELPKYKLSSACEDEAKKKISIVDGIKCEIAITRDVDKLISLNAKLIAKLEEGGSEEKFEKYIDLADVLMRTDDKKLIGLNIYEDILALDKDVRGRASKKLKDSFMADSKTYSGIDFSKLNLNHQFIAKFDVAGFDTSNVYEWTFKNTRELDWNTPQFSDLIVNMNSDFKKNTIKGVNVGDPREWDDVAEILLDRGWNFNYGVSDLAGNSLCPNFGTGYITDGSEFYKAEKKELDTDEGIKRDFYSRRATFCEVLNKYLFDLRVPEITASNAPSAQNVYILFRFQINEKLTEPNLLVRIKPFIVLPEST